MRFGIFKYRYHLHSVTGRPLNPQLQYPFRMEGTEELLKENLDQSLEECSEKQQRKEVKGNNGGTN